MKKKFFDEKNAKIMKQSDAYKGFARTCHVEILNTFNPEIQHKDTDYGIRNKLKDLLTQLRGCKCVRALVLKFKK